MLPVFLTKLERFLLALQVLAFQGTDTWHINSLPIQPQNRVPSNEHPILFLLTRLRTMSPQGPSVSPMQSMR